MNRVRNGPCCGEEAFKLRRGRPNLSHPMTTIGMKKERKMSKVIPTLTTLFVATFAFAQLIVAYNLFA
jgi:hypothetical protein